MSILSKLFGGQDINAGVAACERTPNAVLLDVRERDEYRSGHIPGAVNVPLSEIGGIGISKDRPLFVYCLRGARSRRAVSALKQMGYADARSIGGIAAYRGRIER